MEIPTEVLIHCEAMSLKGSRGTLIRVSSEGYYEVNLRFGSNTHRVLLPISSSVLIAAEPEPAAGDQAGEVER
jgi:hypothetical protein